MRTRACLLRAQEVRAIYLISIKNNNRTQQNTHPRRWAPCMGQLKRHSTRSTSTPRCCVLYIEPYPCTYKHNRHMHIYKQKLPPSVYNTPGTFLAGFARKINHRLYRFVSSRARVRERNGNFNSHAREDCVVCKRSSSSSSSIRRGKVVRCFSHSARTPNRMVMLLEITRACALRNK